MRAQIVLENQRVNGGTNLGGNDGSTTKGTIHYDCIKGYTRRRKIFLKNIWPTDRPTC